MVFVGNNPAGQPAITGGLPGDIYLGPGVGGVMAGGTADYVPHRFGALPLVARSCRRPRHPAFCLAAGDGMTGSTPTSSQPG